MKLRVSATFSLTALLVGCAVSQQTSGPNASSEPEASLASPARALAWLPPQAGKVVSVLEQRRANGVVQDIILSGDAAVYGENKITVTALSGPELPGKYSIPNQADVAQVSESEIAQELEDKFSDMKMGIGDTLERNFYGPFGYAVGTQGKVGCMYAWQTIGRSEPKKLFDAAPPATPPTSIRVKLCRAGANPMAFVSLMRQMAIGTAAPVSAAPGVAYGAVPMYNTPGYGASDALAASGLAGYGGGYGMPGYGAPPQYNMAMATPGYGQGPAAAQAAAGYNGFPASAFGGQAAVPKVHPVRKARKYASRRRNRPAFAASEPHVTTPTLNIPMPDGAGASYSPAPQASNAVFRTPTRSGAPSATIPMP